MRAVVARKAQPRAALHLRVGRLAALRKRRGEHGEEERPPPHQSSFTARTGAMLIASRPESQAVSAASATSTAVSAKSVR